MDNQQEEITLNTVTTTCINNNNTNHHVHGTKKLKHYHSVPLQQQQQQKRDLMIIKKNPHTTTIRLSRSNIIHNVEERTCCNDSTTLPSTSVQSWNVNNNDIKIFPPYLKMERTHCIIPVRVLPPVPAVLVHSDDGLSIISSPNDIANHISSYLKGVAVSTLYDNENAIAHVEFKNELRVLIRLFKKIHENDNTKSTSSSTRTGKDNDCILVEVVRREGCSVQFHREARRILHVAQGLDICALDEDDDLSMKKVLNVPKELRREYLNQFKITDYNNSNEFLT